MSTFTTILTRNPTWFRSIPWVISAASLQHVLWAVMDDVQFMFPSKSLSLSLPLVAMRVINVYLFEGGRERERGGGEKRENEREGPRLRVTTVQFGAPRPQAAGCLIRLQLPPSPSTRARGGQRPPPPGERNEQIRDNTQGGKSVLVITARV